MSEMVQPAIGLTRIASRRFDMQQHRLGLKAWIPKGG